MDKRLLLTLLMTGIGLAAMAQYDEVIEVNVENETVQRYMDEVTYQLDDESRITDYHKVSWERKDQPNPAVIAVPAVQADTMTITVWNDDWTTTKGIAKGSTEVKVYNLVPQCNYSYQVVADETVVASGQINTTGRVRMIALPSISNVRDMGGWPTADGRTIRYGRIYRGSELNALHPIDSADMVTMTTDLAIGAEIDMRAWYNTDPGISAFGFLDARHAGSDNVASFLYTNDSGQTAEALSMYMWQRRWKNEFNFIVENLMGGRNIYLHCIWGANRTGFLAMLLEGLMGVSYSDMVKDYELTTLANRLEQKHKIDGAIAHIDSLPGNTLQEKFNHYFVSVLKVKQSYINYLCSVMLEGSSNGGNPSTAIDDRHPVADVPHSTFYIDGRRTPPSPFNAHRPTLLIERRSDGSVRKIFR